MEHLLDKLLESLEHASEMYQSLYRVVQNEKDAVVGLNLQQLNEACKAKDNLLLKLRILEERREQIMDRVAAWYGCSCLRLPCSGVSAGSYRLVRTKCHKCRGTRRSASRISL